MWLEILAGEHPAAARLGAWLDAHPGAAGLAALALVLCYGALCGALS